TARIWDTATWQAVGSPLVPDDSVEAVAFSPDGHTLAMATTSGRILLWDLQTRERRELPRAHAYTVTCVNFSPDGRSLASARLDRTIRLWNVASGRPLMILNARDLNPGYARSLCFSPDGTQLLAGGYLSPGSSTVVWSAGPSVWDSPNLAASQLKPLLTS